LSWRYRSEVANPLLFFSMVTSTFPLGLGPDPEMLRGIGPGAIWISALLSTLLALDHMFRADFDDGSLEQLLLSPYPLAVLVMAKVLAHWLTSGLPLICLTPVLALQFGLPGDALLMLLLTLLLGTPALSLIGAVGVALTVGLRGGGLLLSLLLLPLFVPVLIFGTSAADAASRGLPGAAHIYMLAALLMLALSLAPLATSAALRVRAG
jgi:heme exporter protein B